MRHSSWERPEPDFLAPGQQTSLERWGMRAFQVVTMVAAIAVAVFGLYPVYSQQPPPAPSAAESFAAAAAAAFSDTALASNPDLTAVQRAAGIPTDPVVGWDIPTSDARHVQLVLPGGLGAGEVTPGGQVIYPDRGAGFEVLAENTGATTGRTITRIPSAPAPLASGARRLPVVTMFVRTPANTVMFARTDGVLTVNDASTGANAPIAAIAPAAARDARGALVPSGFVTTKIKPGLYLLAQVIAPGPDTVFPVYADPGFLDGLKDLGNTIVDTAASAATASVNFVKANPIESIEIAAGGVMVATGVGSAFGVSLIAAGATSLTQKTLQASDNPTLQMMGDAIEIGGYINPTRDALKGVTAIAENGLPKVADWASQLFKHTDDVAPAVPVAPTKLADDLAGAPTPNPAALPAKPGVDTPQTPNAPPAKASEPATPLATKPCAGQSFSPDTPVLLANGSSRPISELRIGDQVLSSDPATGWTGPQPVRAVLVNHDTDLLDLTVANDVGAQSVIHTTAGHPFYRAAADIVTLAAATNTTAVVAPTTTSPGWVDAKDLRPDDPLYTPGGSSTARVAATNVVPGTADMWDLTIETTHTFYITTGAADVLVHNCPAPAPKAPKPEEPQGGVYVFKDADGNIAYPGRGINLDSRMYGQAGPKGKLKPGDTVQVYRTDDYATQRGIEDIMIDRHRTLPGFRHVNPAGRNGVRGISPANPRRQEYREAGQRFLDEMKREPEFTQLPERVQRRLDGRVQAQRTTDAQRSTAQSTAREANQSSRGSGNNDSGSRSDNKPDKEKKKKDKKSRKHHPSPNGK